MRSSFIFSVALMTILSAFSTRVTLAAPVGVWLHDEGAGLTIADSTGNGHTANITWVGGGTWSTDSPFEPNPSNNSYSYGPSEVRVADAPDLNPSDSFTIETWVKLPSLGGNPYFVSKRGTSGGPSGYILEFYGGNTFAFTTANASGYFGTSGTLGSGPFANIQPATDTWYHIAGVHNSVENTLYIDGISNGGNGSGGAIASNSDPLTFGFYAPGDHYYAGLLDEVRLSDTALPPSELGWNGSLVPEPASAGILLAAASIAVCARRRD